MTETDLILQYFKSSVTSIKDSDRPKLDPVTGRKEVIGIYSVVEGKPLPQPKMTRGCE